MSILEDFKKFALRGNMVDLAIGFTVGAAFSTVAKSLVDDILMPPIGLAMGNVDFADLFIVLKSGTEGERPYVTLKEAQDAGAVTLNYGEFINNIMALLVVAIAMFIVIRAIRLIEERLDEEFGERKTADEPQNRKCPHCRTTIPFRATRCPNCTSALEQASAPDPVRQT